MPEQTTSGRVPQELRDAVRIHTSQIEDACIDKDCIEDLRVWLTGPAQTALNAAAGARARNAELLHVYIDVAPITYNRGHYTADLTFFYRITGDAFSGGVRPVPLDGLAVFSKRVVLFGGEIRAKVFSSASNEPDPASLYQEQLPVCTVEVVDPMVLASAVRDTEENPSPLPGPEIPAAIGAMFETPLCQQTDGKRLYVTLGQFSTVRMEREAQLLIPAYDYAVPDRSCTDDPGTPDEPCDLFARVDFPTDVFYPRPERTRQARPEGAPRLTKQA